MTKENADRGEGCHPLRGLAALQWMAEQSAIRLDHLQRLLAREEQANSGPLSEQEARSVVSEWQRAGVIQKGLAIYKKPYWVWLTREGGDAVSLPCSGASPSWAGLEHLYAVNEVRMWVEAQEVGVRWVSARMLKFDRGLRVIQRELQPRFPDGELHLPGGEVIAIEVELSPANTQRLKDRLASLILLRGRDGALVYQAVHYYATQAAARKVERIRTALVTQRYIQEEDERRVVIMVYPPA